MSELSPAQVLGRFAAQTARAELAPPTAEKALTCVLDALGLAMTARGEHTYLALRKVLGDIQCGGRGITLWDDGAPGNLRDGLIVNAWLAHAEFHDDGEHGSWTHPGSLVVPAAVSLGEYLGAPLPKVVAAVAAGYGTLIWLGAKQKVAWGMINRGFRTSAVLGRIGIAVEIRAQDLSAFAKRVYTDRDFHFTYNGHSNLFDPTVGVQRIYWSKNFKKGVPFSNGSHYVNPRVDELLEGAAIENDPVKRKQMFLEFQKIYAQDVPDLSLYSPLYLTIKNKRVHDDSPTADGVEANMSRVWLDA